MLLDSNIIIYAAKPEYAALLDLIAKQAPAVSAISRVEVLGYHLLTQPDRRNFEDFFASSTILTISDSVLSKAIELRQTRRLKLGGRPHRWNCPHPRVDSYYSKRCRLSVDCRLIASQSVR